jgi:putative hydrolase of the HAD superfamily
MTTEHRRFSVFLVPAAGDFRWAEGVIRELAARYDAPPFEPHLTVYGGPFAAEEELAPLRRVLADLAAETGPITLPITGLGVTAEYFKTLFVSFGDEPRLRRLHEAVRGAVPRDSGYELVPHLSLLYADIPLAAKEMAARTVWLDRGEMRFDGMKIVVPDPVSGWSDTGRWRTLVRLGLGGEEKKVRAVLFDFGGVLAEEGFREGLCELARRQGLDPVTVHGAGMEAVYDSGYVLGTGSEAAFWRLMRERTGLEGGGREMSELILARFVLRPRMLDLVRRLRARGYVTAIVSDQTDWLEALDRRDGFFAEFDRVFISHRMGKGKRDPSIFDDVARELGIAPGEALFVDDMLANVVRAEGRGMRGIVFDDEERFRREMARYLEE